MMIATGAGYNPYRKANGEFATKEEAYAQVDSDYMDAIWDGDKNKIAEIEQYIVDNMDNTPLGQRVLETKFGNFFKIKKGHKPLSEYTDKMLENAEIKTLSSNGIVRTLNRIIESNPVLAAHDTGFIKTSSMKNRDELYHRAASRYANLAMQAAGVFDLEGYAAYKKLEELYTATASAEYHLRTIKEDARGRSLMNLNDDEKKHWNDEDSKRLEEIQLHSFQKAINAPLKTKFSEEDSKQQELMKRKERLLAEAEKITLQDGREVRIQEAVIGYSDKGKKIALTPQQKKHIQQEVQENAKKLLKDFQDENGNFTIPSYFEDSAKSNPDFERLDYGSESVVYLHKPTMMVYKVPHSSNRLLGADSSKSSCAINKMSQRTIQSLDKKKLRETETRYLPTIFLNVPTGDKNFGRYGISVQPYLNKKRFSGYTMSEDVSLKLESLGLNDLHSGNVYLDNKTGIVYMNDCVTWNRGADLQKILAEE